MPAPINIYQGSKPDTYLIGDIYDPDLSSNSNIGRTIPAVGSVVIDNVTVPGQYVIMIVDAVDQVTFKSTLVYNHVVIDGIDNNDHVLSYGNDTLMLYFDDRSTPTRLVVDSKFVLVGSASAEYRLVKGTGSQQVVISLEIDNDGEPVGTVIPILDSEIPGVRKLSDCYTTSILADGEFVDLEIFDSTGVLTTRLRMITKRSTVSNDFFAASNPIVGFTAEANQQIGTEWILYVNQSAEDLTIWPEITYGDGTKERIAIDSIRTHIYGLGEVVSTSPEAQFPIMIKHFLSDDIASTIAQGEGVRYLLFERYIRIVQRGAFQFSKIMPIPLWNATTSKWQLFFIGYYGSRDKFEYLAPSAVQYVGTAFVGDDYSAPQNLEISSQVDDGEGNISTYSQTFTISLNGNGSVAPWTFIDGETPTFIYGEQSSNHNRPKLNFDTTRGSYFVPTGKFADEEEFIDNFYYRIVPPYIAPGEDTAPIPTHFIVRDASNGRVLTAAPVAVATYSQEFALISNIGNPAQYNNSTVIVEFLLDEGGSYSILFGVPVEIISGSYSA